MFRKKQAGLSGTVDTARAKNKFSELLKSMKSILNYEKGVAARVAFSWTSLYTPLGVNWRPKPQPASCICLGRFPMKGLKFPIYLLPKNTVSLPSAPIMQLPGPGIL